MMCRVDWKWNRERAKRNTSRNRPNDAIKAKYIMNNSDVGYTHAYYVSFMCTLTHTRCMSLVCSTDTHNLVVELSARIQQHRKIHYTRSRIHHIASHYSALCHGYGWNRSWKRKLLYRHQRPIHQQQLSPLCCGNIVSPSYLELLWTWNLLCPTSIQSTRRAIHEAAKMNAKGTTRKIRRKFPPTSTASFVFNAFWFRGLSIIIIISFVFF